MLMGLIWTAMIVVSVLFGCLNGTVGQVQQAALEGAQAAIELCIVIGGAVCLWCAVMELMRASGLARSAVACAQADTAAPVSGKCAARGCLAAAFGKCQRKSARSRQCGNADGDSRGTGDGTACTAGRGVK